MKKLILFVLSFLPTILSAQTLEEALGYGLPVVVVNTVNGEEPTAERISPPEGCIGLTITNAKKVPGRIRIYYPDNTETPVFDSGEYAEDKSGMLFKLRGNTSALDSQKPFKIKLQKKADMLKRGDNKYNDKNWALLKAIPASGSQFSCPIFSMVGNKVTEILKVFDWVPASKYVNLIVNGDFRGFYQLTETINRNEKCRINVEKYIGYISEIDPYWWNEDVYVESSFLLKISSPYQYTFKYPDSDDITEEQLAAFKEFVNLFDASMENGRYPQLINVESCARWLLAHQLLGTLDGAGSNMYLIRRDDQSKFEMGPLWDFDSIFHVLGRWTNVMGYHYFKWMLRKSPNKLLAREMIRIWNTEKEHILIEVLNFCNSFIETDYAEAIDKSTEANYKRWHNKKLDKMNVTMEELHNWFSMRAEEIDSLMTTLNTIDEDFTYDPYLDSIHEIESDLQPATRKVICDRHLYIIRDNETYYVDGQRVE